jgi:hypothetical protein
MMTRTRTRTSSLVLAVLLATMAGACGGGAGDQTADRGNKQAAAAPACSSRDTTPVGLAVLEYIKSAVPTPQRYLSAAGTDSAVPDDGFKVLQDKGPTYFYTSDPKAQQQIKDKLASVGPYASLLVVYRGTQETNDGNTVTVSLGGHYVGGEHDGKEAATRSIQVQCDSSGWRVAATQSAAGGQ